MKTTVEISDHILARTRAAALHNHTTMRELIEEGLELVLEAREKRAEYTARPVVFGGDGLVPELEGGSWDEIRDRAYEDHGG